MIVEYIYIGLILLIGVIDFRLVLYTFFLHYYSIPVFFAIHCLLVLACILLSRSFNKQRYFFDYFDFFLPGLGTLLHAFSNLLDKLPGRNPLIDEYFDYTTYLNQIVLVDIPDFQHEVNILPLQDSLIYATPMEKKEAITNLSSEDLALKIRILKLGLQDSNPEVVHYAATSLNMIENELTLKLDTVEKEYRRKRSPILLGHWERILKEYLDSGLVQSELYIFYLQLYLEVLEELETSGSAAPDNALARAMTMISLGKAKDAHDLLDRLAQKDNEDSRLLRARMEMYYREKNYNSLVELAERAARLFPDMPESEKSYVRFWLKESLS